LIRRECVLYCQSSALESTIVPMFWLNLTT
jgi:hypothetical protein